MTIRDRLRAVNRVFRQPVLVDCGPHAASLADLFSDPSLPVRGKFRIVPGPGEEAGSGIGEDGADLVISIFGLHWFEDIGARLREINRALKPDGLLMAAVPAEGTLSELRQSLLEAETFHRQGAAIRVDPFPQIRQFGDLLAQAGFRLGVVDAEALTVRYRSLQGLVGDLRDNAAQRTPADPVPPLTRRIWESARQAYGARFADADGKLRASVSVVHASGWKAHESQQKPLRPGSATNRLSDFL